LSDNYKEKESYALADFNYFYSDKVFITFIC
jgi:hypothetical protein